MMNPTHASPARRRPEPSEFAPFYAHYVSLVPEDDAVAVMRAQLAASSAFLAAIPAERVDFQYAPGKWTLRQVVRHVIDTEWLFSARALHFARGIPGPLPGMEQDDVAKLADCGARSWPAMLDEYRSLRSALIQFFDGLDDAAWSRTGTASGNLFTVRALGHIIPGHERHHVAVIRERYLGTA
jgi:hypothetical protein